MRKARASKKPRAEDEVHQEFSSEFQALDEKFDSLTDTRLFRKADRLLVARPDSNVTSGNYEQSWATGRWILTSKARSELATAIRRAQKEQQELWLAWVPLVTALTGLAGTIVAIIALLKK